MLNMPHSVIDLHMHSTASDGRLAPDAVVARAHERGVTTLSLTDHDTLSGLVTAEQAARALGMQFVPGIELSARWARGVVHIVGLNIDPNHPVLQAGVIAQQRERHQRAERIAQRLRRAGVENLADVLQATVGEGVPGRAHFARALVDQGYAADMPQAFKRYLQRGRAGYAPVEWASVDQIVEWIHAAGGVAVFAHPLRYHLSGGALRAAIQAFVAAGGQAIEVSNGGGGRDDVSAASALARRFGLSASLGSDFHDPDFQWVDIGRLAPLPRDLRPVWQHWETAHE